jgi:hypothetical protein
MTPNIAVKSNIRKFSYGGVLLATLVLTAVTFALSADDRKVETIDATAQGTSTELGKIVNVKVTIYEYSSDEDRQILANAFKKGQNQGLVNALTEMKAVGRIAITGTLGYDLSFIRLIPTPTGRKIRFVTNRLLRFGEVYGHTQSIAYNLTAGEIEINDADKDKSTGVLYPAAQLVINKEGQDREHMLGGVLIGSAQPGILPPQRNVLVVPAKPDIGTIVVAEFQRLVLADGDCNSGSNSGVPLLSKGIRHSVHTCFSAEPKIAVERNPEAWLEVVA